MKVLLWQRKLSEVCQYLITQTGTLYRSSMVEHVAVNHRVAGSSPADTAFLGGGPTSPRSWRVKSLELKLLRTKPVKGRASLALGQPDLEERWGVGTKVSGAKENSALSSNGLGHCPFTAAIGIRVPVGSY